MDDFDREVYCIAGLPFDAVNMEQTMAHMRNAILQETKCFLTTPNLNFLALAQQDAAFRQSVIASDLVIADGMPVVWLAKFLRIPIRERVAGSSLFEAFRKEPRRKITAYFFGGPDGVAEAASKRINASSGGVECVGYYSPGFGTLGEMSSSAIIDAINASKADFLVVALGAKKGQAWIMKNLPLLKPPLVSHLGAVVNFEADRLKRAPVWVQNIGLEWLWRIKEEPNLWKRYWGDGLFFLQLILTRILPHRLWLAVNAKRLSHAAGESGLVLDNERDICTLQVSGVILDPVDAGVRGKLRTASLAGKPVELDLSQADYLSPGFLGLILMLKKQLDQKGGTINVVRCNPAIKKLLVTCGMAYLIR